MKDWQIGEDAVFEYLVSRGEELKRGRTEDFIGRTTNFEVKSTHRRRFVFKNYPSGYVVFVLFNPLRFLIKHVNDIKFTKSIRKYKYCYNKVRADARAKLLYLNKRIVTRRAELPPHVCSKNCFVEEVLYNVNLSSLSGFKRLRKPKTTHFWHCSCGAAFQADSINVHIKRGHEIIRMADCNCWCLMNWNRRRKCKFFKRWNGVKTREVLYKGGSMS